MRLGFLRCLKLQALPLRRKSEAKRVALRSAASERGERRCGVLGATSSCVAGHPLRGHVHIRVLPSHLRNPQLLRLSQSEGQLANEG